MAIPKFFYSIDFFEINSIIELSESEARHASQSRRLAVGDEVMILNGKGSKAKGSFVQLNKRSAQVKIDYVDVVEQVSLDVAVACAIPKGDRQKVLIDMLTQLGISSFIPLECEFSMTKVTSKLIEKWQKVAIEACKQSENAFSPVIHSSFSINDLINSDHFSDREIFRAEQHANGDHVIMELKNQQKPTKILILIGPEGGFSPTEICMMNLNEIHLINVGDHILRTETAAIAAVSKFM
jgi:16S rRNA (uracil1498-N3)-methyltransferase